jgi:cell division protein FtsB
VKVDLGIWDRLSRLIVGLLVLAGLVGVIYSYVPGMRRNEALRREIHQREADVQRALERSNVLRGELDSFRDPRRLEHYGRSRLNLARTNEVVLRFVEPGTNGAGRVGP